MPDKSLPESMPFHRLFTSKREDEGPPDFSHLKATREGDNVILCGHELAQGEQHGGPLRRDGTGYICQECWARERGIELKRSPGNIIACPDCGEALMTKHRGGQVSISSLSTKGGKSFSACTCGYQKAVKNPFGGPPQGQDKALQLARMAEMQRVKTDASN